MTGVFFGEEGQQGNRTGLGWAGLAGRHSHAHTRSTQAHNQDQRTVRSGSLTAAPDYQDAPRVQ